jgi:pteridine reductase
MEDLLAGRTALVTGAARRIGAELCLALAARRVNLLIHVRSSHREAEKLVDRVRSLGAAAELLEADFAAAGAAAALWRQALAAVPEGKIEFLINNAAVFPGDRLADVGGERLSHCLRVNSLAPLVLARGLAAQGGVGAVINLLDARLGDYDREHVSYHLSKRMLFSLTRMMAAEFAPRIRVNAVSPGLILPPAGMTARAGAEYLQQRAGSNLLQRWGKAADIVRAVIYLLESEFVTGQVLHVDGGRSLRGNFYGG